MSVENDTARTSDLRSAMPLSPRMIERLAKIDSAFEALKEIGEKFGCDGSPFKEVLKEIDRRRRAFKSKTFFMVTFGMLKAGKSTLVNTFIGKKVSPVGRSKETTLQSSIIIAADERHGEGIYIYSPKLSFIAGAIETPQGRTLTR